MSAEDLKKLSDLLLAFSNEEATKGERIAISRAQAIVYRHYFSKKFGAI